jgi:transposase-like protein
MAKRLTELVRSAIVQHYQVISQSIRQTAQLFDVHPATVQRVLAENGIIKTVTVTCETCDELFTSDYPARGRKIPRNCPACASFVLEQVEAVRAANKVRANLLKAVKAKQYRLSRKEKARKRMEARFLIELKPDNW